MVTSKSKKVNISQAKELQILRKIVEITNSELDLNLALNEVVKVVNDMTKADSVFIYLFDDKRKHLVLMASKTPHKKELGNVTLKAGDRITVFGWRARDDSNDAHAREVAFADGNKLFFGPPAGTGDGGSTPAVELN